MKKRLLTPFQGQKNFAISTCFLLLCLLGCHPYPENSFNGTVRYIDHFPYEQELTGEKLPYIQSLAYYGCELVYPYLLLNLGKQDSLCGIYDLEQEAFMGNFFAYGQGPDDFNAFVITDMHNDSLLYVNDIYRHELKAIRLAPTVKEGKIMYEQIQKYEGIHEMAFCIGSLLWLKSCGNDRITYACQPEQAGAEKTLYKERIGDKDLNHINILADAIKPDGSKLALLPGVLNQIDILSLTSADENISATTATKLPTLTALQEDNYADATYYYIGIPRCNDSCIMALHVHPQTQRKELHVIDWHGNALACLRLKEDLIDFCVDWERHRIYGVTPDEEVYRYDIPMPALSPGTDTGQSS